MDTHIIEAPHQINPLAADQSISLKGYLNDPESREALRAAGTALEFDASVNTGTVNTAIKALDGTRCPNVLVVDLSGVEFELAAMEALANVCEPNVRVIAVGERNDIFLYRRLKSIGVSEYLYKPVNQEYFEQALRDVTGRAPQRLAKARLGKLVIAVGAGGGLGTTTLAVNLASHLSTVTRRRVALLDLDLFSETTSLLLNTVPNAALCEALDNPERVDHKFLERAMVQVNERLDVLGSNGEKLPVNGLTSEGVRIVMEHLQSLYHYTVVDIPTSLASSNPALLAGADTVFVVCDGALASVRNAARLIRSLTPSCKALHTVINRAGAPGEISMAEIETVLGCRPSLVVPFLPKPFANAAILGTPAISGDRRVKTAIGRLAREISGQEAPKPSLLDRILRR
jgi:pilus assembly protein CpaE